MRRETPIDSEGRWEWIQEFQSTPSVRRETSFGRCYCNTCGISIHSLREEGDVNFHPSVALSSHISIHSLREEGDLNKHKPPDSLQIFQSTPSVRRETCNGQSLNITLSEFQSTPSVRRETPPVPPMAQRRYISIHSLREEGDRVMWYNYRVIKNFNPLPP